MIKNVSIETIDNGYVVRLSAYDPLSYDTTTAVNINKFAASPQEAANAIADFLTEVE